MIYTCLQNKQLRRECNTHYVFLAEANLSRVVMADPPDCCTKPKNKVFKLIIKLENLPNATLLACEA